MSYSEQELEQAFEKTKGNLLFKKMSGFLAVILCNVDFHWDKNIPTACTNGEFLKWNPDFFMNLDKETRITVLAHELWHIAFMHMVRGLGLDPETFNIAADHVINLMLKEHGYYMGGFPYYMDSKYINWSTEQVYDDLLNNPKPKISNGLGSDIEYKNGSDKEMEQYKNNIVGKVISAATVARITNQAGDIPGEITNVIDKFLNPQLPWELLLQNFFNDMTDLEYSYRRPNRRYDDPIMPGMAGITGLEHLMYGIDISGSVSDKDILIFNSEVKHIKEEFNPEKLTLVTFDVKIRNTYEFDRNESFEKIVVTGRGGTSLYPLFKLAKQEQPSCLVVFTDLYVDIPPDPQIPVLWICSNNPSVKVPYGNLIHLKN